MRMARTSVPVVVAVAHVHRYRGASRTDDTQQVGRLLASRRAVHVRVLAARTRASRTDETGSAVLATESHTHCTPLTMD